MASRSTARPSACVPTYLLISLCNLQDLVEEPFDQMGLDDIKLDEFEFLKPGPREHAVPVNA